MLTTRLGILALAALGFGVVAGMAASTFGAPPGLPEVLSWFVRAWTQSLAIIAVPLVIAQLFLAITQGVGGRSTTARIGVYVLVVMAGLLTLAATVTLVATVVLLRLPGLNALAIPAANTASPGAAPTWTEPAATPEWFQLLLPQEILRAAGSGELLSLLVITLVVALAARRVQPEERGLLSSLARAISGLAFTAVEALLRLAPVIVFGAVFNGIRTSGLDVGTVLLANAVVKIVVTLVVVAVLYGVVMSAGVPVGRFARAAAPGQLVALATRSSLASLPALMKGAEQTLRLNSTVSGGLLGLAGSSLKLSGPVSSTFKFLFLAHLLGVTLTPIQVGAFVLTVLATSATTVGIPRMTSDASALAFYAAAGMPLEYVVLLSTTTAITDPISTLLNSTAYMTFATVVCNLARGEQSVAARATSREAGVITGIAHDAEAG